MDDTVPPEQLIADATERRDAMSVEAKRARVVAGLKKQDQEDNQQIMNSLFSVGGINPDMAAEAQKLGLDLKVGGDVASRNMEELRKRQAIVDAQKYELAARSPILARKLTDPDFAAISQDDLPSLVGTETALQVLTQTGKNVGGSIVAGSLSADANLAGVPRAGLELYGGLSDLIAGGLGYDARGDNSAQSAAKWLEGYQRNENRIADTFRPDLKHAGILERGIYSGIESGVQNILTLPTLLAGPEAYLAVNVGMVGGQEYGKARDMGLSPLRSAVYAVGQGAVEYATEKIPLGKLIEDLGLKSGVVKTVLHQGLTEIPGEQVATILQDLNEWAALHPEKPFSDYLKERSGAAAETLIATLVATGANTTLLKGGEAVFNHIDRAGAEAWRAQHTADVLKQLTEYAVNSKLRERSPDTFKQFVSAQTTGTPIENSFIDAEQLVDVLKQSNISIGELETMLPGVAAQLDAAHIANGNFSGDIKIPTAQYATTVMGTDLDKALQPHIRLGAEGMSQAEAQTFEGQKQQLIDSAAAVMDQKKETDKAFVQSAAEVKQILEDQIKQTGLYTPEQAKSAASLQSATYTMLAEKMGVTPKEVFDEMGYQQRAGQAAGQTLNQDTQFGEPAVRVNDQVFKASDVHPNWEKGTRESGAMSPEEDMAIADWGHQELLDRARQALGPEVVNAALEANPEAVMGHTNAAGDFATLAEVPRPDTFDQAGILKTDTPAFRAWFGDSKVVDENGKPLVVHHSTWRDFEAFDPFASEGWNQKRFHDGIDQIGSWFTDEAPKVGEDGNLRGRYGPKNVNVYLSIKKPLFIDDESIDDSPDGKPHFGKDDVYTRLKNLMDREAGGSARAFREKLKSEGYDGIILTGWLDSYRGHTFIALDPTQIKSVHNRGTFDPNDPNILNQSGVPEVEGQSHNPGNKHGLMPYLRVDTGIEIPDKKKPLFAQTTMNSTATRQIAAIDEVLGRHPNATESEENWNAMMADALASADIPVPPYAFIKNLNGDGSRQLLAKLSPGQIADADHGFANAAEFRQAYIDGEISIGDTGRLFLWSFLSRGVSPYTQESLFIDSFSGIGQWIDAAADGTLKDRLPEYEAWAKSAAPQGSGQPGAGATHNLNAFGKLFLLKMSEDAGDGTGRSRLQVLHDMMTDPNSTGRDVRRKFLEMGEGVGIDNKVVSFTLLVAGFTDVMVLDRVQIRELWNDGRFDGINLYDGYKVDGKPVAGSALSSLTYGARGLLIYEAIEQGLKAKISALYAALGRPDAASVGRYHWETWVASSEQEASHATIDAILAGAKGVEAPMTGVTAKEGEYGAYAYGARYGRDGLGVPFFLYSVPGEGDFRFTVPAFREFLGGIQVRGNGVIPSKFKVTESGNGPWYNRPQVNLQKLGELAGRFGDRIEAQPVSGADEENGIDAAVPDRSAADQPGTAPQGPGTETLNQGPVDTQSPAFKAWFGKSAVTDGAGNPLVATHYTTAQFEQFDHAAQEAAQRDNGGYTTSYGRDFVFPRKGFFFFVGDAPPPKISGARAVQAYLSIQNPLDLSQPISTEDTGKIIEFIKGIANREPTPGMAGYTARGDVLGGFRNAKKNGITPQQLWDFIGQNTVYSRGRLWSDLLTALGKDGLIFDANSSGTSVLEGRRGRGDGKTYKVAVALEPTQIKSVSNQGTFDPNNPNILSQGPRGGYDPKQMATMLNSASDVSTVMHEFSHFYLDIMTRFAASGKATPQMMDDLQKMVEFGGATIDQWHAWTAEYAATGQIPEGMRKVHEAIAYNVEAYLFEGKAPSVELIGVFDRFVRWMKAIYSDIRNQLNAAYKAEFGVDLPMLTPEVRGVFDRMLASEDEIKQAEAVRNMAGIFQTQADSGMTDPEWAAYQAMIDEARDAAVTDLTKASLRQMQWLSNARGRVLKQLQREHNERRKQVREEVTAAIKARPIYKVMEFLKHGTEDGTPVQNPVKLSIPEIEAMYGDNPIVGMVKKSLGTGKYGMLGTENAIHPQQVADFFGFDSADQMIRQLLATPPLKEAIVSETDARMLKENGDMNTPEARDAAVEAALHNEARARFVAVELRFLEKATTPVRVMLMAAKQAARSTISQKVIKTIKPREYAIAEARAARKAIEAMKKGDPKGAVQAKQGQLLQNVLTQEAIAAKEEIKDARDFFRKLFKPEKKLSKGYNMDLVNAAKSILAAYGIGTSDKKPAEYTAQLQAYNPELYAELEPIIIKASSGAKTWDQLTMDEFRAMRDAVSALWYQARRDKQIMVEGRKVDLETVTGELNARLVEIGIPTEMPGETQAVSKWQKWGRHLNSGKAWMRRVEHWAHATDGPNTRNGPFTKYIWRPLRKAIDAYRVDRNNITRKYVEMLQKITWPVGKIEAPELRYTFGNGNGGIGKAEILGALMHTGNESNLRKLLLGRKWATEREDGTLNTLAWDSFIARMASEGLITKADMDLVQSVWDLTEEIKPQTQKAHHDLFGYYYKEVEIKPIKTPWGTYKGGYVPAKVDPDMVRDAQAHEKMEAMEGDYRASMPSTGMGFTKSRVEYNKPLSLDVRMIGKHIDDTIRFAHVMPVIKDITRILKSQEFAENLTKMDPFAIESMLIPWLNRSARQISTEAGRHKAIDKFWSSIRSRLGISIMFANLPNALQQLTGYFPALTKVKGTYLKSALVQYMSGLQTMTEDVAGLSPFMAERLHNQVFDLQDTMNDLLLNPSKYDKFKKWASKHGYFLQAAFQNQVDVVTWTASFNQVLAELGADKTDEEAVRQAVDTADANVRMTQGSQSPEDVSGFESGTPLYKLFTQFSGYMNMIANLNADLYAHIVRETGWRGNKGKLIMAYMLTMGLPSLISGAIVNTLRGGWDDDDEDGHLDEFMSWFFGSQFRGVTALVPWVGPAINASMNWWDNQPYNDRVSLSPAITVLEELGAGTVNAIKAIVEPDKQVSGKNVRDITTLISLITGIPVTFLGRPVGYQVDVSREKVKPTSTVDYLRGLVTGSASPDSRK